MNHPYVASPKTKIYKNSEKSVGLEVLLEIVNIKNEGCSRRAKRGLSERGSFFILTISSKL
ncbi:MAG: hypothetical protein IJ312_08095 [Treponema sp.]|nr:hypothetical protein [Treponema sp.]